MLVPFNFKNHGGWDGDVNNFEIQLNGLWKFVFMSWASKNSNPIERKTKDVYVLGASSEIN